MGDRAFFTNLEYRFPLIDLVATPLFAFQGIRGVLFFDVGGAWYNDFQDFEFYDSDTKRLQDGVASYGCGVTARFLGLDLNWDFARRWDFKDAGDFETEFWIGYAVLAAATSPGRSGKRGATPLLVPRTSGGYNPFYIC